MGYKMRSIAVKMSLILILSTSILLGYDEIDCDDLPCDELCCDPFHSVPCGRIVSIGAEWSHINREREGGTKQSGDCFGGRLTFDRIKRYKVYYGAQGYYGTGTLNGHQGSGAKIRSQFTNGQIEGSIGYTFQSKCFLSPWITPICGIGYMYEKNNFKHPSPLLLTFTTRYGYFPFGFLSGITVAEHFGIGLNVRFRWPFEPLCRVSNDEEQENTKQHIKEKLGFKIEVPLLYETPAFCRSLLVGILPYYELRHYGGMENYPFDFFNTKLHIYGINLQILYQF